MPKKALGELLGMDRWAEETTIGEWLRGQNEAGLRELWTALRWWRLFLQEHYPKRKPGRPPKGPPLELARD